MQPVASTIIWNMTAASITPVAGTVAVQLTVQDCAITARSGELESTSPDNPGCWPWVPVTPDVPFGLSRSIIRASGLLLVICPNTDLIPADQPQTPMVVTIRNTNTHVRTPARPLPSWE